MVLWNPRFRLVLSRTYGLDSYTLTEILDVGIGVGEWNEFTPHLRGTVEVDRYKPTIRIDNFVQADLEHLPFRSDAFNMAFAYNVLEHIGNPYNGIRELRRVSQVTDCRQDQWFHIGNYGSSSHRYFQLPGLRFLPYPNTKIGRLFQQWLWFFLTNRIHWGKGRVFTFGGLCCHSEKVNSWKRFLVYHQRLSR